MDKAFPRGPAPRLPRFCLERAYDSARLASRAYASRIIIIILVQCCYYTHTGRGLRIDRSSAIQNGLLEALSTESLEGGRLTAGCAL